MTDSWRPAASKAVLELRAELLERCRAFFKRKGVLEVDTPLLASSTVTDPHLHSLRSDAEDRGGRKTLFLQTSPEYFMKRLLASGSGSIYQICKAFRDRELGRQHNPEFTILEWYRVGFDHHGLMDEMDALLAETIGARPAERVTYRELFERHLGVDPHRATDAGLRSAAKSAPPGLDDRDDLLSYLMTHRIEPHLGRGRPTFVHDYPASQAALAQVRQDEQTGVEVAERFEVYVESVELANGFHELRDALEQSQRFQEDLADRSRRGLELPPVDERFLAALNSGLPSCAGVAVGFDRLLMLAARAESIEDVIAFPYDRI